VVHLLYDTSVMSKFLQYDVVHVAKKDAKQLPKVDTGIVNQLPVIDIVIGEATRSAFSSMQTEALQLKVRLGLRQAFVDMTKYLQGRLPLDSVLLKSLGCLNPEQP